MNYIDNVKVRTVERRQRWMRLLLLMLLLLLRLAARPGRDERYREMPDDYIPR